MPKDTALDEDDIELMQLENQKYRVKLLLEGFEMF